MRPQEGYRVGGFQQLREREVYLVVDDDDLVGGQFREMFDEVKRALARRDPYREPNGPQVVADVLRRWGIEGGEQTLAAALFAVLRDDDDLEDDDDE
jgi:hypothetical protein